MRLQAAHPSLLARMRGCGLILGVEFRSVRDVSASEVADRVRVVA